MSHYIMLLRYDNAETENMTEEEYKNMVGSVTEWVMKFDTKRISSGKLKDGGGATLSKKKKELKIDGPYCETKEAIAGFFIFEFDSFEEAVKVASHCPILDLGGSLEVREMTALTER